MALPAGRSGPSEQPTAAVSAQTADFPEHSARLGAEHAKAVVGSADQLSGSSSRAPGAGAAAAATKPAKQEACTSAAAALDPQAQASGSGCPGVVSEQEAGRAQALQLQLRNMKQQLLLFAKWLEDPGWRQRQADGGKEVRTLDWVKAASVQSVCLSMQWLTCLQVLRQAKQLQKDRERLKAELAALAAGCV